MIYDAIIVGARCAGSPTAMLLARRGYRVLLVDKAKFPSDTMSTHYIHQPGIARLKRWGLFEQVVASNCPPIDRYRIDFGFIELSGSPPPFDGVSAGYCPRRFVLDRILVEAARAAGAEVREGFAVRELVTDNGRVTGIRGGDGHGATIVEKARIVIGADGMRSLVARLVDAPRYRTKPPLECAYYTYWSDVPVDGFEIFRRDGRLIFASLTNDGLTCMGVVWTHGEFDEYRANIEKNYLKTLDLAPSFAERVRNGKRAERFTGTADVPNFFRKPHGEGWALVGDAGYHKDPTTAGGITDAFRDAELLVEALDAGFSGRRELSEALAGYERRRNEAATPTYDFYTTHVATLQPVRPEFKQLVLSIRGDQTEINRFCGAMVGTVPIQEYFSPQHVFRLIGARGLVKAMAEKFVAKAGR
jgi:flavin-dependent dehydrogenase